MTDQIHASAALSRGKTKASIEMESGWAGTRAGLGVQRNIKFLATAGIWNPYPTPRSQAYCAVTCALRLLTSVRVFAVYFCTQAFKFHWLLYVPKPWRSKCLHSVICVNLTRNSDYLRTQATTSRYRRDSLFPVRYEVKFKFRLILILETRVPFLLLEGYCSVKRESDVGSESGQQVRWSTCIYQRKQFGGLGVGAVEDRKRVSRI